MRISCTLVVAVLLAVAAPAVAAEPGALAKARALYNAGTYDGAIEAAQPIRSQPRFADTAALIVGRSYLERYRQTWDPADLANARVAFGAIRVAALAPRDQVDLLVGLAQTLYLADTFGAAAELFDAALSRAMLLPAGDRLLLLDWWAGSLDREAQTRPADSRAAIFSRMADRMEEELRADPASAVANYWLAVAARGQGDLDRAWDAAIAGWVRSTLTPESTTALRADLDRLVAQALIPERARTRPVREQQEATTAFRAEWEQVKEHWK